MRSEWFSGKVAPTGGHGDPMASGGRGERDVVGPVGEAKPKMHSTNGNLVERAVRQIGGDGRHEGVAPCSQRFTHSG